MINKDKLAKKFTEIVAIRLDVHDQRKDGVPPDTDIGRWKKRYIGASQDKLPSTIDLNHFKNEVDESVAMLMQAMQDVE